MWLLTEVSTDSKLDSESENLLRGILESRKL